MIYIGIGFPETASFVWGEALMGRLNRPLVPTGPLADFYDQLHALHLAAGQPSMRRLQRLTRTERRPTGINPTSIHAAFVRPRLARWEVVGEIVRVLGGNVDGFAALWRTAHHCQVRKDTGSMEPAPPARPWVPVTQQPVPRELPPDVLPFTGRATVCRALDDLLAEGATRAALMTVALTGAAGVGKSALAVHWAHRVAGHFPDGQLYADLRGEEAGRPPSPAEVLTAFLNALGDTDDPPGPPAALAARYRTRMSGRRMLVLLDNAHSAEQVRPLLPGSPGCLVLVTSRESLTPLVVRHGARRLELGPLDTGAAIELLRELIGARVDAESDAAHALVRRCHGQPLALRIAAERATALGSVPLSRLLGGVAAPPAHRTIACGREYPWSSAPTRGSGPPRWPDRGCRPPSPGCPPVGYRRPDRRLDPAATSWFSLGECVSSPSPTWPPTY
ncbi:NB-ARC domain-containing protein [Micromonospora sp. NPDC023956]|uniref:NB-ARC domain-containing protein n=1 Tax=Micromonospora sp. NPDC023956 TaxID=3155722 RepID=UPI003409A6EB